MGKPCCLSHCSVSQWVVSSSRPSRRPVPYTQIESGRLAVIDESFCRSDPADALRGFGAGGFPSATSRSLKSRKPESGM